VSVIFVVLPLALLLAAAAVIAFIWATRRGQFDDLDTAGLRMLHDDEDARSRRREPGTTPSDSRRAQRRPADS